MGLFYGAGQCILDTANNCNQGYKSLQTFIIDFAVLDGSVYWQRLQAANVKFGAPLDHNYSCTKEIQSIPLDFSFLLKCMSAKHCKN